MEVAMGQVHECGFDDYRYANHPILALPQLAEVPLRIRQDFRLGKGGILWDGAFLLAKYVSQLDMAGRRTIELGAGTALPSIVACAHGASVVATDLPALLPLATSNFAENAAQMQANYQVEPLNWSLSEDLARLEQAEYDYVLLADVFYLPVKSM